MFNKLEAAWNARTPVYLHNGTKENFIFQITLAAVVIGACVVYDEWETRRQLARWNEPNVDSK